MSKLVLVIIGWKRIRNLIMLSLLKTIKFYKVFLSLSKNNIVTVFDKLRLTDVKLIAIRNCDYEYLKLTIIFISQLTI